MFSQHEIVQGPYGREAMFPLHETFESLELQFKTVVDEPEALTRRTKRLHP